MGAAAAAARLDTRHISSRWYVLFFILFITPMFILSPLLSTAMAATTAPGARDVRVSSRWYVYLKIFYIYFMTNVYFGSTQCVETAMAATAAARPRDATRLEPVCFIFLFFYFTTLIFILGPLNNFETAMAAAAGRDATRLEPRGCFFVVFFFVYLLH
jgi:uncharacterized BrkB/YihY/UPF0761 family membrane protein